VALKTGANARLRKGIQLADEGRLREAAEEHEAALATDPELVQAHVNLIKLYAELGQPARAEDLLMTSGKLGEARWKATTLGQKDLLASIDKDLRALGQDPAAP
jgi:thioredoxin-like negative regulator of GroEL